MKNFIDTLLGHQAPDQFFAIVFFALIGVTVQLLFHVYRRNPASERTPAKFSWSFFIMDNARRILLSALLIYIAIRFTPELFGVQVNEFWALAIGLGLDKLAEVIKDKTNMLGQKKPS